MQPTQNKLSSTYLVRGREVRVQHFERVAARMNFELQETGALPNLQTNMFLPLHGKMPALRELLKYLSTQGITRVGCFASHGSNWAQGVAVLASLYNFEKVQIVYATNPRAPKYPEWLKVARAHGAELVPIRPNMTAINSSQAKMLVEKHGAYFIPFGLDTAPVLEYLTEAMTFPNQLETLVLCCGSGITLVGIIQHLIKYEKKIKTIVGVSSGRPVKSIMETLTKHVDLDAVYQHVDTLALHEGYTYSQIVNVVSPWPTHQWYERKAYDWLTKNIDSLQGEIQFLNMGV